jgi:hypothetical protein
VSEELRPDGYFFPPDLVPSTSHPLVTDRGPATVQRLLTHRLYDYLHFTTELEQVAVIPVTMMISREKMELPLPLDMLTDAFKITTDEAWHAQFSNQLIRRVETDSHVAPWLPPEPQFRQRLRAVTQGLEPNLRSLQSVLFALVSETLISSTLTILPKDCRLPCYVRSTIADHAEDEGRHHAYFRSFLYYIWPALSADIRREVGPLLPDLIFAFLEPDYRATAYALNEVGLTATQIDQVLSEAYPRCDVVASVAAAARSTIRYFADVGVLEDPLTRDRFLSSGLVQPGDL